MILALNKVLDVLDSIDEKMVGDKDWLTFCQTELIPTVHQSNISTINGETVIRIDNFFFEKLRTFYERPF